MKKVLLGTSALVAAGLIAGPAMAQLELEVSASFYWEIGFKDDDVDDDDEFDMQDEGWLRFDFVGTADNGLRYGFQFDLDDIATDDGVEVDETFMFVQGNFGLIRLGDDDGAHGNLRFFIPTVGIGGIDGGFGDYVGFGQTLQGDNATDTGDATKILYQTDGIDLGGFVFGVSYNPDASGTFGNTTDVDRDLAGGDVFENGIEVGARWTGSFGDVDVGVGGGYTYIDSNSGAVEEVNAFTIGLEVGTGGFTGGVQFAYDGESSSGSAIDGILGTATGATHDNFWRVTGGVTYETGPWGFGVNAFYAQIDEVEVAGDTDDGDLSEFAIGGSVNYELVPGLDIAADLVYFDFEADVAGVGTLADVDNNGVVGILRTSIGF